MINWISCKHSLNPCLLQFCLLLVAGSQILLRQFSLLIRRMGPSAYSSDTWLVATAQEDTAYLLSCSDGPHTHLAYHKSEIKMYLLKSFSLQLTQIRFTSGLVTVHFACLSLQLIAVCAFRSTNPRFRPRRWWWWWWWCLRPWCYINTGHKICTELTARLRFVFYIRLITMASDQLYPLPAMTYLYKATTFRSLALQFVSNEADRSLI